MHRSLPVNLAKFLRTTFLQNTSGDCFCKVNFGLTFYCINPFSANFPLLYPLKTENLQFADFLKGYRSRTLAGNRLIMIDHKIWINRFQLLTILQKVSLYIFDWVLHAHLTWKCLIFLFLEIPFFHIYYQNLSLWLLPSKINHFPGAAIWP